MSLDYNNDRFAFYRSQGWKHVPQSADDLPIAPTAATEENQARTRQVIERKQSWIIQISRNDHAPLLASALHYFCIGGPMKPKLHRMNSVVAFSNKPSHQRGRQWHVDQEPHFVTSTVSSSAREAA